MSLFDIAKSNIFKNLKNYSLYIFSMIFTVSVFLSFKTLKYAEVVEKTISGSSKLTVIFNAATIVIAVFSFVFIWYSNNFFLRKRKKEIGLYALLGIENKSIAKLLFFETLLLGVVSMIFGAVFGVAFSSIAFSLLTKLTINKFAFAILISPKAIFETILMFLTLFVIVSVQSSRIIHDNTLLELFKASSKREEQPKASITLAIASLMFIGSGYALYFLFVKTQITIALVTLVLVVIGTYLFFGSMLFFYIKSKKKNRPYFYKGMNLISTSQLLYRVKGNSRTLATIAILTATTLTAVGAVVGLQLNFKATVDNQYPFSYSTESENLEYINEIEQTINNYPNNMLTDKTTVKIGGAYGDEHLSAKKLETLKSRGASYEVISESEFKKILSTNPYGIKFENLENDNDIIIFKTIGSDKDKGTKSIKLLSNNDEVISTNVVQTEYRALVDPFNTREALVVKDSLYEKLLLEKTTSFTLFQIENKQESEELNKDLTNVASKYTEEINQKGYPEFFVSYFDVYHEQSVTSGTLMFIGLFLGLIFLVCTGSIIFFKQITEAQEEIQRYTILKNIGVNNSELKASVLKQVAFVFAAPFVMGTIHSAVAITFIAKILEQKTSIIMLYTLVPYLLIYIFYYIMTSKYYYNTIKNQEA